MDQDSDPAGVVLEALKDLREVLHARDWAANAGYRGDPTKCRECWARLGTVLAEARDLIHKPKAGQGLASIWLKAIAAQSINIEAEIDKYQDNWEQLLFGNSDVFNKLLEAGWEKGCYIVGFGRTNRRPIAKALLPSVPALVKLRTLAERWRKEYAGNEGPPAGDWREKRELFIHEAANYLFHAVNMLEVSTSVIDDAFCTQIINDIDQPERLIWPHIIEESPDSLIELVEYLSGGHSESNSKESVEPNVKIPQHGSEPYPEPNSYGRDKWVYENIHLNTFATLSLKFKERARIEHWELITVRNAFKKSADRYADYHGFPKRGFKGGNRS